VQRRSGRQDKIALSVKQADRDKIAHSASNGVTAREVLIGGYLALYVGEREGGRKFRENKR
jgi:hypothetical protein